MRKKRLHILLTTSVLLLVTLIQCSEESPNNHPEAEMDDHDLSMRTGEQLANTYCSGCHLFPEPKLLDKRTWATQTMPAMGPHLGIFEYQGEEYSLDVTDNLPENYYPERAVIDTSDWHKILNYYENQAPERLQFQNTEPSITVDNQIFNPRRPAYRSEANPMASAVRFDPGNKLIYLGDAAIQRLLIFDTNFDLLNSFSIPSPVSHIEFVNDPNETGEREMIVTFIGDIAPSDRRDGAIVRGRYDPETGEGDFGEVILENVGRPVESLLVDLDMDGLDDLLVSEFGHRTGSMFWLKGAESGFENEKLELIDRPGCLQSHATDFNENGLTDILALCSQLDQAIYLFENQGNGEFERKALLKFPITAGSSSFELADFNGDGHPDILYTSGDNADYSITYKPYHGVYIYVNDGNNYFIKEWFYPVNGAYSARASDFTNDGNIDIALTSFFADYAQKPEEGFIFFKHDGDLNFTPYHPQAASYGRWIAMDVADWSRNGADDIVLANFSRGPTKVHPQIENILTQSPHFLVLENHSNNSRQ